MSASPNPTTAGVAAAPQHPSISVAPGASGEDVFNATLNGGYRSHWVDKKTVEKCENTHCDTKFKFFTRKVHCRRCGHVFCSNCAPTQAGVVIGNLTNLKVPVCGPCYSVSKRDAVEIRERQAAAYQAASANRRAPFQPGESDFMRQWTSEGSNPPLAAAADTAAADPSAAPPAQAGAGNRRQRAESRVNNFMNELVSTVQMLADPNYYAQIVGHYQLQRNGRPAVRSHHMSCEQMAKSEHFEIRKVQDYLAFINTHASLRQEEDDGKERNTPSPAEDANSPPIGSGTAAPGDADSAAAGPSPSTSPTNPTETRSTSSSTKDASVMDCEDCCICMTAFLEDSPDTTVATITKCNHTMHTNCLAEWMNKNATCPLCRESLHNA